MSTRVVYYQIGTKGYSNATWKYTVWVVIKVSSRDSCIAKALSESTAGRANKSVDLNMK
jgi:hypothetical protein